jgi:6-phosphofructokinase 2
MEKIITITLNPALDKTIMVDELVPDKKLRSTYSKVEPGGGGINVSRAIKQLGGETRRFIYVVDIQENDLKNC